MKTMRLLFAALAVSLVAACTNDVTAPDLSPSFDTEQTEESRRGQLGSGGMN